MKRNQGSALIVTLIVLVGLTATLAALSDSEHISAQEMANRSEHARAKQAYMDGVQNALSILSQIVEPGGQSANTNTLTATNLTATGNNNNTTGATMLSDDWATEGQNGDVRYLVGDHSFRMQIVDACSFMNINCSGSNAGCNTAGSIPSITQAQPIGASDQVLNNLPLLPQDIESIEDFRSASVSQQALGAKDPYYQNLPQPYNAKLLPFETFDELMQVQGLTAKLLYYPRTDVTTATNPLVDINGNPESLSQVLTAYSVSPQTTPTGTPKTSIGGNGPLSLQTLLRMGISGVVANAIVNKPGGGWASLGQVIQAANRVRATSNDIQAILNNLRVSTTAAAAGTTPAVNGLVNINTASASVLQLLPGVTTDIANAIVSQQAQGFLHVGDIMTVGGVTPANIAQFADRITATSQTFIIRVIGTAGTTSIPVEAVVTVTNNTPQIVSITEQPFPASEMINRWTWDASTTTDTVLKDNS